MNVIPFTYEQANIRVIEKDGEPWFVAKDVAELLGYTNTSKAVSTHCKSVNSCPTEMGGQVRHVQIIPERDVYRLIMRSKLPGAEKFENWVVSDVLPSIRKKGAYSTDGLSRMEILKLAMQAEEENLRLKAQTEADQPKVEAYHLIADSEGSLCITDAAKSLQLQPKRLFTWLSIHKWIYRRPDGKHWIGYQDKLHRGMLEHKVTTVSQGERARTIEQVRVTAKGLAVLAAILGPTGPGALQ